MIEIFLTILALLGLAKHSKRSGRRYSLRRVRVTPGDALTTLGSATVVVEPFTGASTISYRAVTIKGVWTITGLTPGEGPIICGVAHSNYSVTEIKECLESAASISPGLKIEEEQANRLVRIIGTFSGQANHSLNDGKPIKTRLNWLMPASASGSSLVMFNYNDGSGALTTGANVRFNGDLWVKDSV